MKLSTISKLAAVAALCVAGYVDAHAQTNANNDASVGTNSAPTGICAGLSIESCDHLERVISSISDDACWGPCGYEGPTYAVGSWLSENRIGPVNHPQSDAVVAAYQKQLARHTATASTLIKDNAEILSPSCLVEVETLQRSLRNAYSSTGGQLPLNEPPFDRKSPEFRGYVAALVDQSRKTSGQIESMVTYNCRDPNATAFFKGAMVGPVDAAWFKSWDGFLEGGE